ncbi:unnamed protein product [Aphanomyces euteiches]|uniref:Peptidase S1 domain-containing protein n=1 Tax=Aphanomyces euteiches TaxID=100861 RepID=A0A6G0XDY7_9STRA|nr:hypothetical protein Ae201684_005777 [Aphanomyces euteiches]KAH9078497.1 hypothetical protein Ae201684P_019582 [Aphanomyces euteiches]KAH9138408.1 hypothetical protein AeRB84_017273 [Aphanomyces euteiches]
MAVAAVAASSVIHVNFANGTAVGIAVPSYIATIRYEQYGSTLCTGSLIAPRFVLTTVNCIEKAKWVTINANTRVGVEGEHIRVLQWFNHPKNTKNTTAIDVGVLLLEQDSQNQPATLDFTTYPPGTSVIVRGYGRLGYDGGASTFLREANGTIMANGECNKDLFNDNMMCIVGVSLCNGDLGAPVTVTKDQHDVVIAQASWIFRHCSGSYGVYSNLGAAKDFLGSFLPGGDVCKQNMQRPSLNP